MNAYEEVGQIFARVAVPAVGDREPEVDVLHVGDDVRIGLEIESRALLPFLGVGDDIVQMRTLSLADWPRRPEIYLPSAAGPSMSFVAR